MNVQIVHQPFKEINAEKHSLTKKKFHSRKIFKTWMIITVILMAISMELLYIPSLVTVQKLTEPVVAHTM